MEQSKVILVGELHQDLFYRNTFFSDLILSLAKAIKQKELSNLAIEQIEKEIQKIIDDSPKKIDGEALTKRGGNGNNSAELLAKLNIPIKLLTTVGKGAEWMFAELKELGIDTDAICQVTDPTPISTIIEDPRITKIMLANNFKQKMNFDTVTIAESQFQDAKIVFFTPIAEKYTKVLLKVPQKTVLSAFTLELQKIQNLDQLLNVVPITTDIMFANLNDAAKILGLSIDENDETSIRNRLASVSETMQQFSTVQIYTLGKYGSWICPKGSVPINIPIISVTVKNRTGAGDTFAAGFIAYIFNHLKNAQEYRQLDKIKQINLLKQAAEYATVAAALKVSTGVAPNAEDITDFQKIKKRI